ncbi:hypothetical protein ANTPLA_LOCUS8130 [Anthophora plagiata]
MEPIYTFLKLKEGGSGVKEAMEAAVAAEPLLTAEDRGPYCPSETTTSEGTGEENGPNNVRGKREVMVEGEPSERDKEEEGEEKEEEEEEETEEEEEDGEENEIKCAGRGISNFQLESKQKVEEAST